MKQLGIENAKVVLSDRFSLEIKDFTIKPGDILPIVGINGSGKSTLLRLLAGIISPTEGRVSCEGRIVYQPQKPYIFHASCIKNAMLAMDKQEEAKALPVLEQLGLLPLAKKSAVKLSGGEAQKLILARSLLASGDFLLLDEPMSSVDERFANEMVAKILDHVRKHNMALLVSTHNMITAASISDKAVLITNGQVQITDMVVARKEYRGMLLEENGCFM